MTQLLLTGAAGYTGKGIAQVLQTVHDVRGLDIHPSPDTSESLVADLADLDACRAAVAGTETVVMCHMAPNPVGYETPPPAIDVNVKGTANLFHAMVECHVTRCVLISSTGVAPCDAHGTPQPPPPGIGPYNTSQLYSLTKGFQEMLAAHYFHTAGIVTTILRPSWIVYDETQITKYGTKLDHYDPSYVDPRDIGTAVLNAMALPDPTLEAFILAQDDFAVGVEETAQRLNWRPKYNFASLRGT